MAEINLAELRKLLDAATPGPWHRFHDKDDTHPCKCGQIWSDSELLFSPCDDDDGNRQERRADGRLLVAARNALPELISEIRSLRDQVEQATTRAEAAEAELREIKKEASRG